MDGKRNTGVLFGCSYGRRFLHLEECRYNAQELSRDQKFYKPIKAYCRPAFVDPKENTIKGHVINKPVVKPAEVKK